MKIRTKIFTTFIITALISFLILGYLVEHYSLQETIKTISSSLSSNGRARAEHVVTFINDQKKTSDVLAAASVYRDFLKEIPTSTLYKGLKQKIDDRLVRTLEADSNIKEVFIIDRDGKLVVSSDKTQEGQDKSKDPYFLNARERVYLKDVYYSETVHKMSYTISSPVTDTDGTFLGVSVLRYFPNSLFSIVTNENGLGSTEENFIINHDKYLLTPSLFLDESNVLTRKIDTENTAACFDKTEVDYINKNGYKGLKNIATHADAIQAKDYRGIDVIATHTYIPDEEWCLVTKVDKADALKVEYALIIKFWIYIGISLFIFITIVVLFINKIIGGILSFVKATRIYSSGDFNYRFKVKGTDEIAELAQSFNSMASSVAESRGEIDRKVKEQTSDIIKNKEDLDKQRVAILNILEDVQNEKIQSDKISKRLNLATNSAKIGVWEFDVVKNTLTWDDQMYKLYGINREDFSGAYDAWQKGLHPDDRKAGDEAIQLALKGEKDFNIIFRVVWPDGTIRFIRAYATVERDTTGKPLKMIGVNFDVTSESEIDKAKSEFVSLASHQLRTPLSTINWYAEMILDGDVGPISADQKKYLDEIYSANKRMVDLVNALLNVSKIDLGTFVVEPVPVSLAEVVKNVLDELQQKIVSRKVTIKEDIEELPKISLDPKLIHIVFQNILSNAVKYTHENGLVEISIKTMIDKVDGFKSDKGVLMKVKDNGMGIPESEKYKMFTKLYRADNARESESEGTGLGLYLAKSIVENSGGKIWFESKEKVGTTFFVLIPFEGMKKKIGDKPLV